MEWNPGFLLLNSSHAAETYELLRLAALRCVKLPYTAAAQAENNGLAPS